MRAGQKNPVDVAGRKCGPDELPHDSCRHTSRDEEVGHWKPSPELFFHAAREMGVAAAACVVVEDSLPGIAAGLAAGMRVYSMCDPGAVPAEVAAQVVRIDGLGDLHMAFGLAGT